MTPSPLSPEGLAACPYCETSLMRLKAVGTMQHAYCDGCGSSGPLYTDAAPAIAAWNRRADLQGGRGEPVAWLRAETATEKWYSWSLRPPHFPNAIPVYASPPSAGGGGLRMLTIPEMAQAFRDIPERGPMAEWEACQRKFCEVNGLSLPSSIPTPSRTGDEVGGGGESDGTNRSPT